jgi:hypothetical protein
VEVRVKTVGAGFDEVIARQLRDMKAANKTVGNAVKKAGVAAHKKAFPYKSFMGGRYPLKIKGKVKSEASGVEVEIYGTPIGFFAMIESGTRPHKIRPRSKESLAFGQRAYEEVDHPGASGTGAWTKSAKAAEKPMREAVEKVYSEALGG